MRRAGQIVAVLVAVIGSSDALSAQVRPPGRVVTSTVMPPEFGPLTPPESLGAALRDSIQARAGHYPFVGMRVFGRDSALLVFDDSTYTAAASSAGTWMFGPPVTAAEADSCPPEKVLGRRIARVLWRGLDRPASLTRIVVAVRGTGEERWNGTSMYFYRSQLEGRWLGDPGTK